MSNLPIKQYCRYCVFCFEADDFRCSNHPQGKQLHWTRKDINRENHCPNFQLHPDGDVETGKEYRPRETYKTRKKIECNEKYEQMNIWLSDK